MSVSFCVLCTKRHDEQHWKYAKWQTETGEVSGWACKKWFTPQGMPEFVPQRIKDDRVKFAADMVQSHRGGELSREFVELYPDRAKGMIDAGVVTKEQVKKSKYVWKEIKGIEKKKKIDASVL